MYVSGGWCVYERMAPSFGLIASRFEHIVFSFGRIVN